MTVVLEVRDLTIGHGGVPLLDEIAFDGPVALQGFGLQGSARDNLRASMAAWRELHAR